MTFAFSSCKAQTKDKINLSKIIFHSSRCNGTCPSIDLEIDSTKSLFVDREYFKTKSETDKHYSGQFKGVLSQSEYDKLLAHLQKSNIDILKFPDVTCCDGVITKISTCVKKSCSSSKKWFKKYKSFVIIGDITFNEGIMTNIPTCVKRVVAIARCGWGSNKSVEKKKILYSLYFFCLVFKHSRFCQLLTL